METTQARLEEVASSLRGLQISLPPDSPVEVSDCRVDSGWVVSTESRSHDYDVSYTSADGWTASGRIFSFEGLRDDYPYVGLSVEIDGIEPCGNG